ncbi:hypothetical protein GLW08_10240 [Pontibacillus yanchengensis]|uniref:Uncharacterized protein n=2 Tax=Pontibacillus yanchengensis TaxID=462910 RepID=A0ACC7VHW1_9BACI|nr:AimR family lysis-lysogeny pheromone receptor [Pontibacillus yanchengensis]MYL34243.1 hypothetical protein [Pontibacillus yanchengensis]MYL53714.1 hypothetical protein [Pontibacillus yanchengensis]
MNTVTILKDAQSSNLSLYTFSHLVPSICDNEEGTQLMRDYCLQSNSPEARYHSLEFFLMNGYGAEFIKLLHENKYSSNLYDQIWAQLYELLSKIEKKEMLSDEVFIELEKVAPLSDEQTCVILFIKLYCFYDMNRLDVIDSLTNEIYSRIEVLEPSILKDSLLFRLNEVLQRYHWRRNELILSRKYGYKIIKQKNISLNRKCKTHQCLGLSYLYDSYDQAMFHLKQARNIAERYSLKDQEYYISQQNIPFVSAYHHRVEGITSKEPSEQAHIALAKGDYQEARIILSSFQTLTSFQMYYLGIATQNHHLFIKSYNKFVNENSHHFFARLPLRELKKME